MTKHLNLVAFGVLVVLTAAVTDVAAGPQTKCLAGKNECVSKAVDSLLKCEKTADPNAGACIDKARAKFGVVGPDTCFGKLETKTRNDCVTFDDTAFVAMLVDVCVQQVVGAIDPAPLTQSKCNAGKKMCAAQKLRSVLTCHRKAETPGKPNDPNADGCLDKTKAKFDGGADPTKGCFTKLEVKSRNRCLPPLGNAAEVGAIIDDVCVAAFVAALETPATTTTTTTSTTTTTAGAPSVSPEVLPPVAAPDSRAVVATAAPGGALLRWHDSGGEHWRRVGPDGSWIDPGELVFPPDIAGLTSDGVGFRAATTPGPDLPVELYTLRLSAVGTALEQPVLLKSLESEGGDRWFAGAQVAYQDGAYFVLWSEIVIDLFTSCGSCSKLGYVLGAARLSSGATSPVTIAAHGDQHGLVVPGAGGFGVLWSSTDWEHFPPPGSPAPYSNRWKPTAWSAAIAPATGPASPGPAVALPPRPVLPVPWPMESDRRYNDEPHALVSDGESYLILWVEKAVIRGQLRHADLSADGDEFVVSSAPGAKTGIAAAFTGAEYLVVWTDGREAATNGTDVYGARVTRAGSVVDLEGFPLVTGTANDAVTSLAATGGGAVVTYDSILSDRRNAGNARSIVLPATPGDGDASAVNRPGPRGPMTDR